MNFSDSKKILFFMLADSAFVEVGHERGAVRFETSFNPLDGSVCAVPNFITSNFSRSKRKAILISFFNFDRNLNFGENEPF